MPKNRPDSDFEELSRGRASASQLPRADAGGRGRPTRLLPLSHGEKAVPRYLYTREHRVLVIRAMVKPDEDVLRKRTGLHTFDALYLAQHLPDPFHIRFRKA
jgi:hypothetical protein